jgi:hypothetical protein
VPSGFSKDVTDLYTRIVQHFQRSALPHARGNKGLAPTKLGIFFFCLLPVKYVCSLYSTRDLGVYFNTSQRTVFQAAM